MATPYDLVSNNSQYPAINGQQPIVDQSFGTPAGTPTNNILPNYNNSTGQQIGQYYGVQLAPGQVGFGNQQPGSTAPPTGGNTAPGATTTGPAGFLGKGTREQQLYDNLQAGTGAWNNGMNITSPQAWQDFKFTDPNMSQWMKNANMIANPIDRFRYMFGGDTGGATGHNESKTAMIKAGIDPQVANRLADTFMGTGANYAQGLGLNQGWNNRQQNMFQLGNQLWGVQNGQRYLVQDFGDNNWESGHQIDRHRAGGPDFRPGDIAATGNQSLQDWSAANPYNSTWFRGSSMTNPGIPTGQGAPYVAPAPTGSLAVNQTELPVDRGGVNTGGRTVSPYRISRSYQ